MVQHLWADTSANLHSPIRSFHHKTKILHRALKIWQADSFGPMEKQLQYCKDSILFFDRIEEQRSLSTQEFKLRILIRERAFLLANNIELKWRQRSRCRWVAEGDRNTRFFHSFASSRLSRNFISEVDDNGRTIADQTEIRHIFLNSMQGVLGVSNPVLPFDARALYPTSPDLSQLQLPFSTLEIERAVMQLANHKASGPDGLPNEFIKNYWHEVKDEICEIIKDFYENRLELEAFNEAKIVLIPKMDSPRTTSDYRPISVLNLIPKLISKILSNRLRLKLLELISVNQTAFVQGRQISENFVTTRELLHHVARGISGLQVNFAKRTFIPINIAEEDKDWVRAVMNCSQTSFPTVYLGMSLTLKKPTKDLFLPLIEKVERRLQGWQSKLLSRGGRLQLVQSVLSTVPIYHMICFILPKWVVARIDRARRSFLWGRGGSTNRTLSLCNWSIACLPKDWGGLGLSDLYMRNFSLILRWWWKLYKEPHSIWTQLMRQIRWHGAYCDGPLMWSKQGSFFWIQLHSVRYLFDLSIIWVIGNGHTISFWYDCWGKSVLVVTGSRQQHHRISLRDASTTPLWDSLIPIRQIPTFVDVVEDELKWRWTAQGTYTAKSVYSVLVGVGRVKWHFRKIWNFSIPPTIKVFIFLLLQGKLLTKDVMQRRNFGCTLECVLCQDCQLETAVHLFFKCNYASAIWDKLASDTGTDLVVMAETVQDI
ncbi:uncharacterized protein LOC144555214 [Carex rostrata]